MNLDARGPARGVRRRGRGRSAVRWPRSERPNVATAPIARGSTASTSSPMPRSSRCSPPRACASSVRSPAGPDPRTRRSPWSSIRSTAPPTARVTPVLGDLAVRARRRRSVVRAGAERCHRHALHRGAGQGRVPRRPAAHAIRHDRARSVGDRPVGMAAGRRSGGGSSGPSARAALSLCDVAAGHLDGYVDGCPRQHAPWDYLGGLLVCREAGAADRRRRRATSSRSPTPTPAGNWWRPAPPSCSACCATRWRRERGVGPRPRPPRSAPPDAPPGPGPGSCSTRSARRAQRPREGAGRLGQRRRHRQRGRGAVGAARRRPRARVLRRGDRRRARRRRLVRRPARRHRQLRARLPAGRRVGRTGGRRRARSSAWCTHRCWATSTRRASGGVRSATASRSA